MLIQWFPGHMAKARREAIEKLKLVDLVIELLDARLPESSRNPLIDQIIGNKPRLIVLNKADLADKDKTEEWLEYYNQDEKEQRAIAISTLNPKDMQTLKKEVNTIMAPKMKKLTDKGVKPRAIRLMILGIPNVGKSTLINKLLTKNRAVTGNRPGVTKGQQWLKIDNDFELLDTPGILWPKFEDQVIGKKLALTGAIKDTLFHKDEVALFALAYFLKYYPGKLQEYYKIDEKTFAENTPEFLMGLTTKFGFGEDYGRASEKIMFDIRNGKLGPYTLDSVEKSEDDAEETESAQ
jgi:ribosome biogenesis GTPase A